MRRKSNSQAQLRESSTATPTVALVDTHCRCFSESQHARGRCPAPAYSDVMPPPLTSQRHEVANLGVTAHQQREAEFVHRFKHYGCTVKFHAKTNARWSMWAVEETKTGAQQGTGFDSDMERLLAMLASGLKLEQCDLIPRDSSHTVKSDADPKGNRCAVCDEPGGLPCPTMLRHAFQLNIKLALTEHRAQQNAFHVHPGRCRKRLKQLIEVGKEIASGRR